MRRDRFAAAVANVVLRVLASRTYRARLKAAIVAGLRAGSYADPAEQVEAERDQLRQQVEKLLGAVEAMRDAPWGRREEREADLYQAADQVRKELEG